jgi:exodeoxyribonuclease V beta subunit
MDELLVVSFSRESTRELRGRVRERLVSARDGLAAPPPATSCCRHLADCDPAERVLRHRRLRDALASFDAATVTTTHGFCQQVLLALGTAGDHDVDAVLVEDMSDLVAEVANDFYLRKWGAPGTPPPELSVGDFRALATAVAVSDPATRLVPDPSTPGLPGLRARIAAGVREETERRKRACSCSATTTCSCVCRRPCSTRSPVRPPSPGCAAATGTSWSTSSRTPTRCSGRSCSTAFHGHRTLVLIGDPKQAIYAFRGADVHAYLQATEAADSESTLPDNWRSDAELLRGLDAVFRGAALGDPRIRVLPVQAAHQGRLLTSPAAVRLRVQRRDGLALTTNGLALVTPARTQWRLMSPPR